MLWEKLLSDKRFGMESYHDATRHERTDFQRDYDRLIFSAPFRRLQNKTQVFPLPGSIFVHNRLTHSMEVSCVGRSMGEICGKILYKKYGNQSLQEIGAVVSASCLAHDLGNPPFGHSGEKAISSFFSEREGRKYLSLLKEREERISDFTYFEGNANSLRILSHQFKGRREGGFAMTYSMLASIVKYPYSSEQCNTRKSKFGFFYPEERGYRRIAEELGIIKETEYPLSFARYPLVYLVEAADDICYEIMDIEDAHKLKIISTEECIQLFLCFFEQARRDHIEQVMSMVGDINEKISYLRSCVIGTLIDECTRIFIENEEMILEGKFEGSLIKNINPYIFTAYKKCSELSMERIYRSKDVLDIELAGFRIINFLLECFLDAVFTPNKKYSELMLERIPEQYETDADDPYTKIMSIVDYVSGMTDVYALDLYQKITGANLPAI